MFDIGFFELIIIGILALLVLGPERLPTAARTAGVWIGRIKQSFGAIQQEVNQQLHMEDMQRQLEENRRKLEDTLRQQEQSIMDTKPAAESTPTANASTNTDSAVNTGTDDPLSNQSESSEKIAADEMTPIEPKPSVLDEGPFGTTEPERKG